MRGRQFIKGKPGRQGGRPQQKILGIGHFPGRKGPSLYYGNEYSIGALFTFRSEAQADAFMDLLTDFFEVPKADEEPS